MTVRELQAQLANWSPDAVVLVRLDGSIFATDNVDEHEDYNDGQEPAEFYVLAVEFDQ